jgi:hypothetical protein
MAGGMHGPAWVLCHLKIDATFHLGRYFTPSRSLPPPLPFLPLAALARLHDSGPIQFYPPIAPIYHLVRSPPLPPSSLDPQSKEARHPPLCLKGSQAHRRQVKGERGILVLIPVPSPCDVLIDILFLSYHLSPFFVSLAAWQGLR